jgi:hypothetical protein
MIRATTLAAMLLCTTASADTGSIDADGTVTAAIETPPIAFVIENDLGGRMGDYYEARNLMYGNKVVIDGACMSACVMFLRNDFGLDVCMTPRAVLGFHKPYLLDKRTHTPVVSKAIAEETHAAWLQEIYDQMPRDIRDILKDRHIPSASTGEEPNQFYTLTAVNLMGAIPFCAEGWQEDYVLMPKPTNVQ